MSKERVCHILNQHLGMRKLSARWVSHLLTLDQKRVRMNISNALMSQFRRIKSELWHRLITVDETWIHRYTPETKILSKQWICKGSKKKKQKLFFLAGKVMATVFWDSHGVFLIVYLKKTLTGAYYASLLDKLKAELAEKRPHLQKKKTLFHQDNTPSHASLVAMAKNSRIAV
ncbi:histone-lysine N-methyltransferase SETMAR [Trichonephila clavipes]|nr:histone-lysine N-methyltransferase SETMAR [Trichonephila clavipes]